MSRIEATANEWFAKTRALLSVLLATDMNMANDLDFAPDFSDSYVGLQDDILYVFVFNTAGDCYIIEFNPQISEASYSVIEDFDKSILRLFINGICTDGYLKNDVDDISQALEDLITVFK